ncbi:MAG: phosphatidylglycerophosphatase A [Deltaproteobacteria bacterium]|nr:MAG: phosphatidylglycerophosphatase A [Deltaproteobacteria bacterium]RLC13006.1 MAG: phosphatidylglycerophosphatase A [Deltaproteobacteria bacterium]HHE75188.1 phosphatidylglycerophosphatase A [Desulfobacteraceae bacterium]
MTLRKKIILFLSSGCLLGNMPFAPGSFGTLAGLPICWLLSSVDSSISFILIALAIPFAIWVAGEAEQILEKKDPGAIVIDEIVGMVLTLAGLPFSATTAGLGFVLFRVLDITKPFPIGFLERRFKGGTGIVLDDVAAGVIANITLRIILQLFDI